MTNALTPYDTGVRATPQVWANMGRNLHTLPPIERELAEDRYGKVDFENDEGSTVATVWLEKNAAGEYTVHIDNMQVTRIEVHHD